METCESAKQYLLHLVNRLTEDSGYSLADLADDLDEFIEDLRDTPEPDR